MRRGTGWGEGGYVRIAMTGDGPGACGMLKLLTTTTPGTGFNKVGFSARKRQKP